MPGLRGRRLGRRLQQRDPAADRGPARPAQGPHRPVVARLPAGRRARPGDRLPAGVPALVRPAPEGHRDGDHGRAAAARVDAGPRARRPRTTRSAPGAGCPSPRGRRRTRRSGRGTSRRERADLAPQHRVDRPRRRRLVRGRRRGRLARRPARRGRALADASPRRRSTSRSRSSASPRSTLGDRGRPPERARRRAPVRRRPRRRIAAHHPRRAQPQPPRRPRRPAAARARPALRRHDRARRHRPARARRAPAARRAVDRVLAVGVAHRRAGHAHAARRPRWRCRRARRATRSCADFGAPEWAAPLAVETIEPGRTNRTHTHDPATGAHELRFEWDVGGHRRLVDSAHRDGRHPRHDLPHRRRRSALGRACACSAARRSAAAAGARASTPTRR